MEKIILSSMADFPYMTLMPIFRRLNAEVHFSLSVNETSGERLTRRPILDILLGMPPPSLVAKRGTHHPADARNSLTVTHLIILPIP